MKNNYQDTLTAIPNGPGAGTGAGAGTALVQRTAYQDRRAPSAEISTTLLGAELTELTREELFILAPVPRQVCLPLEVFGDLRARKVKVRLLYTVRHEPLGEPVATLARGGIALPTPLHLPYFLVVRDRAVVYLPHQDPRHPRSDRLTRVRSVVMGNSMAAAFTVIWENADERARAARITDGLDRGEDLLHVLGDGLTDDRAAARLHMSKRTFARRVADMMDSLNAKTRFQAGVQAARRGWI